jgi:hypothetical protein
VSQYEFIQFADDVNCDFHYEFGCFVIRIYLSKCTIHKILSQGPIRENNLLLMMYVIFNNLC